MTYPDLLRQWTEKAENVRLLFDRFLDHDGNAQRHERLTEVNDALSLRRDGHWRYGDVRLLQQEKGIKRKGEQISYLLSSIDRRCVNFL